MRTTLRHASFCERRHGSLACVVHHLTLAAFLLSAVHGIAQAPARANTAAMTVLFMFVSILL